MSFQGMVLNFPVALNVTLIRVPEPVAGGHYYLSEWSRISTQIFFCVHPSTSKYVLVVELNHLCPWSNIVSRQEGGVVPLSVIRLSVLHQFAVGRTQDCSTKISTVFLGVWWAHFPSTDLLGVVCRAFPPSLQYLNRCGPSQGSIKCG